MLADRAQYHSVTQCFTARKKSPMCWGYAFSSSPSGSAAGHTKSAPKNTFADFTHSLNTSTKPTV